MLPSTKLIILFIEFHLHSGAPNGLLTEIKYINDNYLDRIDCIVVGKSNSILCNPRNGEIYKFFPINTAVNLDAIKRQPFNTIFNYILTGHYSG